MRANHSDHNGGQSCLESVYPTRDSSRFFPIQDSAPYKTVERSCVRIILLFSKLLVPVKVVLRLMNVRFLPISLNPSPGGLRSSIRQFSSSLPRNKQRVVILGSGWGGYSVLRGINKKDYGMLYITITEAFIDFGADVVVISPNTYFNFTPLLASTAVGTLEFRCAIEPVSLLEMAFLLLFFTRLSCLGSTIRTPSGMFSRFQRS